MGLFSLDRYRSVSAKLVLVGLFVVLAIGTVAVLDARAMQDQYLEVKKQELHGQTDSMISLMGYFESLADQGVITEEDARAAAMGAVGEVRYAGQEYFWIQDHSATVLMHPIKPELDDTDQSQLADENGVQLFTKISYVAGFELQGTVASAVEEQSAVTAEIGRAVNEAATGVSGIAESASTVADAAGETTTSAASVLDASRAMSELAQQLQQVVVQFRLAEQRAVDQAPPVPPVAAAPDAPREPVPA